MILRRKKTLHSPRLARKRRRLLARRLLFGAAAAVLLGVALWYGLSRPAFLIADVEVAGAPAATASEISSIAKQELAGAYGFLIPKRSALFYPADAIERGILTHFPQFSAVRVSLKSAGALLLTLAPRQEAALLCSGGRCFEMDETGFVFAPATAGSEKDALAFSAPAGTSTPLGRFAFDQGLLSPLFSLVEGLRRLGIAAREVRVESREEITVALKGGGRLIVRQESSYASLLARLEALLADPNALPGGTAGLSAVSYIDLRYGNKVYVKPR